jgi:hypothetical protein
MGVVAIPSQDPPQPSAGLETFGMTHRGRWAAKRQRQWSMSASFRDSFPTSSWLTSKVVGKGMVLEELRNMGTLAAAVRELKRNDPVKWSTLDESLNPY